MKKVISILLILTTAFCFISCNNASKDKSISVFNSQKQTIVLDPGHGGENSIEKGAEGYDGTAEYTLNDSVAVLLKEALEKEGYNVIYTREPYVDNEEMTLTQRTNKINEIMPDLVISIHHDASNVDKENVKGYTIYYSNYKPVLDNSDVYFQFKNSSVKYPFVKEEIIDETTYVTYKENEVEITTNSNVGGYLINDETPCKEAEKSLEFANILDGYFRELSYIGPINVGVDSVLHNEFRILRMSKAPSVLLECGFVSNPKELDEIKKESNQKKLVKQIVKGVNNFFDN